MTNLLDKGSIIGSVDIWRCRQCGKTFCEDKHFGQTELSSEVGLPPVEEGARWAVLVCFEASAPTWSLMTVKPLQNISHSCRPELLHSLAVDQDFQLRPSGPVLPKAEHKLFLIEGHENKEIEVRA